MTANGYQLLVFDWDGTVMDSADRIVGCIQATLEDLGLPPRGRQEICNIIGLSLVEAMETLYPEHDRAFHQQLIAGYRRHWLGREPVTSPLFPGAAETLQRLNAEGYLLAVATGKSRRGLEASLDSSGCAALFHASRCADEAPSKPHPGMLEQLMDQLGVMPEATLMIGDTDFDLLMARNAGASAVAVTYGAHPRERLAAAAPRAFFDDLRELPPWLHRAGEESR